MVLLLLICPVTWASDTLRTVSEYGHRVFNNLNMADTLNGSDRFDSTDAQRCIRDAVGEIGAKIGVPKVTSIATTDKTMSYEVDEYLVEVDGVLIKKNRFSKPILLVSFDKFLEAYVQQGISYDTGSYSYCAVHGDSLYLYPIPARVDTINVIYWARGDNVSTFADTVTLPYKLYPAVEYLATAKAAGIIKKYDDAKYYRNLYDLEEKYFQFLFRGIK